MSKYYTILPENIREIYNIDELSYLMPDRFSNNKERFHLFRYESSTPKNTREWDNLIKTEDYYKDNSFSYKIQENNGILYYTEYCNSEEIANMVFGEPEYALILKTIEGEIYSFQRLYNKLKESYSEITELRTKEVLTNLKNSYIIYYKDDFLNIVSIINLKR
jgi:hypothetical protein